MYFWIQTYVSNLQTKHALVRRICEYVLVWGQLNIFLLIKDK